MNRILKTPYLRNILILSTFISISLPLFVIFAIYPAFSNLIINITEQEAVKIATHFAADIENDQANLTIESLPPEIQDNYDVTQSTFNLMKLKIFKRSGEVIFSSDAQDIGQINRRDYFHNIVAKGKTYTKAVNKNASTLEGQVITQDVVETYVPIVRNGRFIGAFEIYYDITEKKRELNGLLHSSALLLILLSTSLGGTIIIILHKASVTVSQQAEIRQKLQREKEFSEAVLNSINDPISIVEPDSYKVVAVNNAFVNHARKTREAIIGKTCHELTHSSQHPCSAPDHKCPLKETLETGFASIAEHIHYRPNGEMYYVDVSIYPIKDKTGRIDKVVHLSREISERKQAQEEKKRLEEKLSRSQKMEALGLLAGGVAHDLNNVLSGIVSYPDLILLELEEDSPLRKPILTMQASGQKAAAIVQDLLTLARRGVTNTTVLNLNDIVSEYLQTPEFKKLMLFHQNVTIDTRLDEKLKNIVGSDVHLKKTLMNLISNAAEALPNGGLISVSTENVYVDVPLRGYEDVEQGEYALIVVTDNGTGIDADDLKRIFEPFYTKKVMGRSGTGLGMSVVWGTVQDHRGYINVLSQPGTGTTFRLYFPATSKTVRTCDRVIPMSEYMGQGETVLIIDDVPEQRELASRILEKLGYTVANAPSGEDGVEYLKLNSVDLVILDMIMDPGLDGLETYKQIIAFKPGQKALIASGFSETERVMAAQRLGAGEYIKKPYTMERLGLAVLNELNRPAGKDDLRMN